MRPPPLLIGATLAFWGWQSSYLLAALGAALVLEAARWLPIRWEISSLGRRRIGTLCTTLLIAVAGYCVATIGLPHAVIAIVELLPFVFLPLIGAQVYSANGTMSLATIFRSRANTTLSSVATGFHLGYPFIVICILSAAAANTRSPWFYPVATGLCVFLLWQVRPTRYSAGPWVVLVTLAAGCGYAGQFGLSWLQGRVIAYTGDLIAGSNTDPYQSVTDIGHIGELKLSDRILVRLRSEKPLPPSFLLHRASYNSYVNGKWLARAASLSPMTPTAPPATWRFGTDPRSRSVSITTELTRGIGVLPVPSTALALEQLNVEEFKSNRLGTVRVENSTGYVRFTARYGAAVALNAAPDDADRKIPAYELVALEESLREWGLSGRSPADVIVGLSNHFGKEFRYSIFQSGETAGDTPVADFLRRSRAGHCEYFATATVLLLRAAGIPARYATGYSVQEYSELEGAYVVRQRHAHAWARYYLNGRWTDLDTTPGIWAEVEQKEASIFEPIVDLVSWLRYRFSTWRSNTSGHELTTRWLLLMIVPLGFALWRLRSRHAKRLRESGDAKDHRPYQRQGLDSSFYRIERHFCELGLGRRSTESQVEWIGRLRAEGISVDALAALQPIVRMHYRYRFDPSADAEEIAGKMKTAVSNWLHSGHTEALS